MERKLNKSLKRSKNLTRIIIFLAISLYLGVPSFAGYLLFFSDIAKANIEQPIAKQLVDPQTVDLTVFNNVMMPYEESFGLNTVTIIDGNEVMTYLTPSDTVSMILAENNITFDANDIVLPDLNETVASDAVVQVIRIDTGSDTETLEIPFRTIFEEDPLMPETYEEVLSPGIAGTMIRRYDLKYENGELVSKKVVEEEITAQPIPEVIIIGTRRDDIYDGANSCSHWDNVIDSMTRIEAERNWLKYMIRCESHCNTYANNSNRYFGILQFTNQLFFDAFKGNDIFNGNEQIEYALSIYRSGFGDKKFPYCSTRAH